MGAARSLTDAATGFNLSGLEPHASSPLMTAANSPAYPVAATYTYDFASGAIHYEEYHPFGTSSYRAADSAIEVSAKRYRYVGKERDEETGLYYCSARYLAAWLGRWTAADPLGLVDGPGRYSYSRGNPIRLQDPNGTAPDPSTFDDATAREYIRLVEESIDAPVQEFDVGVVRGDVLRDAGVDEQFASAGLLGQAHSSAAPSQKSQRGKSEPRPGDRVPVPELNRAEELLALSNLAYDRGADPPAPPEGFARLSATEIESLGIDSSLFDKGDFQAALFKDTRSGEYVLANRGSQQFGDFVDDATQAAGFLPEQYETAVELGHQVYSATEGNVVFTGHSLGGGLAATQALATGGTAVTFNAAGPSPNTRDFASGSSRIGREITGINRDANRRVSNYRVPGEIVTGLQESLPGKMLGVEAVGTQTTLRPVGRNAPIRGHFIDPGLNQSLRRSQLLGVRR